VKRKKKRILPLNESIKENKILRCGQCKYFMKKTIAKNGCKIKNDVRHHLNKACSRFETKPFPTKIKLKIATFSNSVLK
jgi:hypothetical protein